MSDQQLMGAIIGVAVLWAVVAWVITGIPERRRQWKNRRDGKTGSRPQDWC